VPNGVSALVAATTFVPSLTNCSGRIDRGRRYPNQIEAKRARIHRRFVVADERRTLPDFADLRPAAPVGLQ
jgi:hypothetical protein